VLVVERVGARRDRLAAGFERRGAGRAEQRERVTVEVREILAFQGAMHVPRMRLAAMELGALEHEALCSRASAIAVNELRLVLANPSICTTMTRRGGGGRVSASSEIDSSERVARVSRYERGGEHASRFRQRAWKSSGKNVENESPHHTATRRPPSIERARSLARGNAATTATAHSELGHATQYGDSTNKRAHTHTGTKANNRETQGERRSRVRVKRNGLNGVDETTLRYAPTPRRTADHTAHLSRSLARSRARA